MDFSITPLNVAVAFLMGAISAYIAHRRNKNPYGWFAIGFVFGLVGILAIIFLSARKKKGTASLEDGLKPILPQIFGPADKFWYYVTPANEKEGPMSFEALNRAFSEGKISQSTYVWHDELSDWKPLENFFKEHPSLQVTP